MSSMYREPPWPIISDRSLRKIRFSNSNELFEIDDPNASVAADCPDLSRVPSRSCLRPSSSQLSVPEAPVRYLTNELYDLMLRTPRQPSAPIVRQESRPRTIPVPTSQENGSLLFPTSLNLSTTKNPVLTNNKPSRFTVNYKGDTTARFKPHVPAQLAKPVPPISTEKPTLPRPLQPASPVKRPPQSIYSTQVCSPTKLKQEKTVESKSGPELSIAPLPTDFWSDEEYYRNRRFIGPADLDIIFAANKRRTTHREFRKSIALCQLTIVELVRDRDRKYVRCYTNADLPLQIVIVPYALFPDEKKVELNSTWTAEVETIEVSVSFHRRVSFSRVAFGQSLSYQGPLLFKGDMRHYEHGSLDRYSKFIQYHVPLTQIHNRQDGEQLRSVAFGQIDYNRNVLGFFPNGVAAVEGEGWIEPLPGMAGVMRSPSRRRGAYWLLVEPFVETKDVKCHLEDTFIREDPQIWAEQSRKNREEQFDKERKRAYSLPLIPVQNIPKIPGEERASLRLRYCHSLVEDLLKVKPKNSIVFERPDDVLINFRYGFSKRQSLKTLAEQSHCYLDDEAVFEYLKINEPLVLRRLCQILAWSLHYSNINLDYQLQEHVFKPS